MPKGVFKRNKEIGKKISISLRKRIIKLGYKNSPETRLKMSLAKKGKTPKNIEIFSKKGDKNTNWKGEYASYTAKHMWIRKHFGKPSFCEMCKTTTAKKFEWANISKKYKREISDWKRLCTKCHRKFDKQEIDELKK